MLAFNQYTALRIVAMGLGGALLVIQAGLLLDWFGESAGKSPVMAWAVIVGTVTLAMLPTLIEVCWRHGHVLKGLALLSVFVLLLMFSLTNTIGRSAEMRDVKVEEA